MMSLKKYIKWNLVHGQLGQQKSLMQKDCIYQVELAV